MIFDCHGTASAAFFKHHDLGKELAPYTVLGKFVTARLEIDYKKPTPMNEEVVVIATPEEIGDRKEIVNMQMHVRKDP